MAFPVVASSATSTATSGASIVASFPSGLTAGDEMFMTITRLHGSAGSLTVPSGWTLREQQNDGVVRREHAVLTKTATAGDVSAGSVTVSFGSIIGWCVAHVLRITGSTSLVTNESDKYSPSTLDVTPTFTTNVAPTIVNDSLILLTFGLVHVSQAVNRTFSSYATTPSATYTEVVDTPLRTVGDGVGSAIASANYTGFSTITSRQATVSADTNAAYYGSIFIYAGTQDVVVDVGRTNVSPTIFGATAAVNIGADVGHQTITPTIRGAETKDTSTGQVWTPVNKS